MVLSLAVPAEVVEPVDQLAGVMVVEMALAEPGEGLVAAGLVVGVDRRQVDLVLAAREVGDDVAAAVSGEPAEGAVVDVAGLAGCRIADRVEHEDVVAGPAGHAVGAEPADDAVVAAIAVDGVVAGKPVDGLAIVGADQPVGTRRAGDVLGDVGDGDRQRGEGVDRAADRRVVDVDLDVEERIGLEVELGAGLQPQRVADQPEQIGIERPTATDCWCRRRRR